MPPRRCQVVSPPSAGPEERKTRPHPDSQEPTQPQQARRQKRKSAQKQAKKRQAAERRKGKCGAGKKTASAPQEVRAQQRDAAIIRYTEEYLQRPGQCAAAGSGAHKRSAKNGCAARHVRPAAPVPGSNTLQKPRRIAAGKRVRFAFKTIVFYNCFPGRIGCLTTEESGPDPIAETAIACKTDIIFQSPVR